MTKFEVKKICIFFSAEKFQKIFKKISQKYATEERILRP